MILTAPLLQSILGLGLLTALEAEPRTRTEPPNIVLILVDDLGWTDLGCFGSDLYETPNIDQLANEGVRFVDAYSACTVCSPTRAALLTGKTPAQLRVTDWIHGHKRPRAKLLPPIWTEYLPDPEVTIAEALGSAGYTTASMGKWHLGDEPDQWPTAHGFDINIAGYGRGSPPSYFSPYRNPNLEDGPDGEHLPLRLAAEARRFIESSEDSPFFLYLPFYSVHTPLQGRDELIDYYQKKLRPGLRHTNPTYAAMVHALDEAVGIVLNAINEAGVSDNTLVIFTSDNGGLELREITENAPLRAGKGSAYEGGVRVPLIVRWPGVTPDGSLSDEPVISYDIYPTLLEIAGITGDPAHNETVEGQSIRSLLQDPTATLDRPALYWHYPHYHPGGASPYSAIRAGHWRLIEFFEDQRIELYNLDDDPSETKNLAGSNPAKASELHQLLQDWRAEVDAQLPRPNPAFEPPPLKEVR